MFKLSQRYTLVHIAYLYSINDVAYVVNQSKLSAYANDTHKRENLFKFGILSIYKLLFIRAEQNIKYFYNRIKQDTTDSLQGTECW